MKTPETKTSQALGLCHTCGKRKWHDVTIELHDLKPVAKTDSKYLSFNTSVEVDVRSKCVSCGRVNASRESQVRFYNFKVSTSHKLEDARVRVHVEEVSSRLASQLGLNSLCYTLGVVWNLDADPNLAQFLTFEKHELRVQLFALKTGEVTK